MHVKKRTGEIQPFNVEKIKSAVEKAMARTNEEDPSIPEKVIDYVTAQLNNSTNEDATFEVDEIHRIVENGLMKIDAFDTAREYVTYRKAHMPDIFRPRVEYKPFEYPNLAEYVDAIQQSYWVVSEYNFTSDVQDFKVNLSLEEKEAVRRCMLAISQVEVAVKTFWGKIGDRLPKPEIQEVGATFSDSECYDDITEVLCDTGWKRFGELTGSDKVAQYNHTTGEISFTTPISYLEKNYSGVMHHYYGVGTDICVTPDHEILVMHPQKNVYEKRPSSSGKWSRNYRYPSSGAGVGGYEMTDTIRLLIAIQADGSLYGETPSGKERRDFTFNLSKDRKVSRIKSILSRLEIPFNERQRADNGQTVISGFLPDEISTSEIKNFDFIDIQEVNPQFGKEFIEELSFWDSHVRDSNVLYYNTNEKAIDKVQAIASLSGMTANKSINRTEEQSLSNLNPDGTVRKSSKDCYVLSITDVDKKVYPIRKEVDYDGKVYCVTVPDGNIVTRRNKRVAIQGNCRHSRAYAHLLEILGLNSEFAEILEVPAIKKRVNYAQQALEKAKTGNNKDYVESVLLFSLFIENVSLFSQFLIISQMNKQNGTLKGISNVIAATSLEETTHNNFGCDVVNTIRKEHPEWFDDELNERLSRLVWQAFDAEKAIIEWIFEEGELPYLSKEQVIEYVKNRFNMGLEQAGFQKVFVVNESLLEDTRWFDVQNVSTTHTDFFAKRSVNYTKFSRSFTEDDLFD